MDLRVVGILMFEQLQFEESKKISDVNDSGSSQHVWKLVLLINCHNITQRATLVMWALVYNNEMLKKLCRETHI